MFRGEKIIPGAWCMAQECRAGPPFLNSHRGPWSKSLHHSWDSRALPSCLGHRHGHRLEYQTAGINHIHSFSNLKMTYFGVDDKFVEKKERSHVLQKLKIKWKETPNWKLFIQKMSWRIFSFIFVSFFCFQGYRINSHLLSKQTHRSASKHPSATIA